MPHGSGSHHGGGGGGGGHHGGGGGFHHHHHVHRHNGFHQNRHHRYRDTGNAYYSYGPYWYRRRPLSWLFLSVVLTVAIIVCTSVAVRYTASNGYTDDDGLKYAPTDTRIIPFTGSLCQSLRVSLENGGGVAGYNVSLYMLSSPPQLTGRQSFSVETTRYLGAEEYVYYYYYMNPGSSFTVTACIAGGNSYSIVFYLFEGNKDFREWVDEPSSQWRDTFRITEKCNNVRNRSKSYQVKNENYYYLVFETTDQHFETLQLDMSFERTYYEPKDNSSIVESCSVLSYSSYVFGTPSCSVSVPLSGETAFLEVVPLEGTVVDWTDGLDLGTSCAPRIWMYAIISIAALIGCVSIIAVVVIVIFVCIRKRRKSNLAVQGVDASSAPLLGEAPQSPLNPNYQQEPGKTYGSNYESPPMYKP